MDFFHPFTLPIPIGFTTTCAVVIGRLPVASSLKASNDEFAGEEAAAKPDITRLRLGLCPGMGE